MSLPTYTMGALVFTASLFINTFASVAYNEEQGVTENVKNKHVLILGTYHFGNPGLDLNNMKAEDVLSNARQSELEALTSTLAKFKPTAIMVEGIRPPPYNDLAWQEFEQKDLMTIRNERVQIAYRLAHHLGLDRVYAVDEQPDDNEPDYFPYDNVAKLAKKQGRLSELENLSGSGSFMRKLEEAQATSSIPELLKRVNGKGFTDEFYWKIIRFGEGETQPGAELAAYWFMRNAKIFNKIEQVTRPGDRILIVYGAGHGHWLREITEKSEGYVLDPVIPYLDEAAAQLNK